VWSVPGATPYADAAPLIAQLQQQLGLPSAAPQSR